MGIQLSHGPSDRPVGPLGPGGGQLVDLAKSRGLARLTVTGVAALAPHHAHGQPDAGQIVQQHRHSTVSDGEHPAERAAHQGRHRFHHQGVHGPETFDSEHINIRQIEERARRRVINMEYVEAFEDGQIQHPILDASTPNRPS